MAVAALLSRGNSNATGTAKPEQSHRVMDGRPQHRIALIVPSRIFFEKHKGQRNQRVFVHILEEAQTLKSLFPATEKEQHETVCGQTSEAETRKAELIGRFPALVSQAAGVKEQGTSLEIDDSTGLDQESRHFRSESVPAVPHTLEARSAGETEQIESPEIDTDGRVGFVGDIGEEGGGAKPVGDDVKQMFQKIEAVTELAVGEPTNISIQGKEVCGETSIETSGAFAESGEFGPTPPENQACCQQSWTVCEGATTEAKNPGCVVAGVEPKVSVVSERGTEEGKNTVELEPSENGVPDMNGFGKFVEETADQNSRHVYSSNLPETDHDGNGCETIEDRLTGHLTLRSSDICGDAVIHNKGSHVDISPEARQETKPFLNACTILDDLERWEKNDVAGAPRGESSTVDQAPPESACVATEAETQPNTDGRDESRDATFGSGLHEDRENVDILHLPSAVKTSTGRMDGQQTPSQTEADESDKAVVLKSIWQLNGEEFASCQSLSAATEERQNIHELKQRLDHGMKSMTDVHGMESASEDATLAWSSRMLSAEHPQGGNGPEMPARSRESENRTSTVSVVFPDLLPAGVRPQPTANNKGAERLADVPVRRAPGVVDSRVFATYDIRDARRSNAFHKSERRRLPIHRGDREPLHSPFASPRDGRWVPGDRHRSRRRTLEDLGTMVEMARLARQHATEAAAASEAAAARVELIMSECRLLYETAKADILRTKTEVDCARKSIWSAAEEKKAPVQALPANAELQTVQEPADELCRLLAEMRDDMLFRITEMEHELRATETTAVRTQSEWERATLRSPHFKHSGAAAPVIEELKGKRDTLRGREGPNGLMAKNLPRGEGESDKERTSQDVQLKTTRNAKADRWFLGDADVFAQKSEHEGSREAVSQKGRLATTEEAEAAAVDDVTGSPNTKAGEKSLEHVEKKEACNGGDPDTSDVVSTRDGKWELGLPEVTKCDKDAWPFRAARSEDICGNRNLAATHHESFRDFPDVVGIQTVRGIQEQSRCFLPDRPLEQKPQHIGHRGTGESSTRTPMFCILPRAGQSAEKETKNAGKVVEDREGWTVLPLPFLMCFNAAALLLCTWALLNLEELETARGQFADADGLLQLPFRAGGAGNDAESKASGRAQISEAFNALLNARVQRNELAMQLS
ncbi:hypothetical protein TGPRC2_263750 [Toxoplasma gondii TgCatPRC2]|uniref:Uncharacterized protein n=3 Tax=Toxoplasma gondii TaxID=5811 RepID=A0A151HMX8_TOXGO|nr:hypothetical protein TGME49_263750 [Toxoplasma gondii ME49]EPT29776.1 hypothetical protein TGME49_263750 [Toxoplasma gondii ME49]KYF40835.1 hypothetical protein TGARI_263750 [Toxoplasma gondii ARI]KYK70753.1 hypothetical protein TGPRC2_263750 [Toxoplasma gondii TgCatPRC2]|eukprot:XP_002365475.1 hypothetical protein TGME49_263750 [Toxoplasma gondii ME49]